MDTPGQRRFGIIARTAAAAALGVPSRLRVCVVPLAVAGDPLGALLLLADEAHPLDADRRRLLSAVGGAMGFALLRDRLVDELRTAAAGA